MRVRTGQTAADRTMRNATAAVPLVATRAQSADAFLEVADEFLPTPLSLPASLKRHGYDLMETAQRPPGQQGLPRGSAKSEDGW